MLLNFYNFTGIPTLLDESITVGTSDGEYEMKADLVYHSDGIDLLTSKDRENISKPQKLLALRRGQRGGRWGFVCSFSQEGFCYVLTGYRIYTLYNHCCNQSAYDHALRANISGLIIFVAICKVSCQNFDIKTFQMCGTNTCILKPCRVDTFLLDNARIMHVVFEFVDCHHAVPMSACQCHAT